MHWPLGRSGKECDFGWAEFEVFEAVQVERLVDSEKWGLNLGGRTKLALGLGVTSVEMTNKDRGKSSRRGLAVG